jgi:nitroreductase
MDVFQAIGNRRSIREYTDEPVPREIMDRLLEAARVAPSTSNTQSWKFKVVTDPRTREKIGDVAYGQKFVAEAPVIIACCLDFDAFKEKGKQTLNLVLKGAVRPSIEMVLRAARGGSDREFSPERVVINGTINVAIASEHIVLAACALGLGTCWIRAFEAPAVQEILDIPEGVTVVSLLTVGYPAQSPGARPRRGLEEILL